VCSSDLIALPHQNRNGRIATVCLERRAGRAFAAIRGNHQRTSGGTRPYSIQRELQRLRAPTQRRSNIQRAHPRAQSQRRSHDGGRLLLGEGRRGAREEQQINIRAVYAL
jgi:hypothetical protein